MNQIQRFKLYVISLIVAFILFLNFNVLAQKIDYTGVEKVALNAYSLNSNQNSSNFRIKEVIPISNNSEIAYYIFNFEPKGHIVVSNDKAFEPILGYGLNSTIDFDSIPPGLKYLLNSFKEEISYTRKQGIAISKETIEKWDYYLNLDETSGQKSYSTGTYLLQTIWGQDLGFNRFCPLDPNTNNRTIVGCGGVALGQILYYWQCRVFPDNSISYTPTGFPSPISLTFSGQNYNWSGMSKTSSDDYNALLLYHSAVSIRSNFTDSSTTSYTNYARTALVSYFGFNANNTQYKNSYTNDTWINMLKTEINAERPIFYAGYNNSENYGHAWVIDGYDNSNYFHCNWGWHRQNNSSDWYLLSALNVAGYSFNDGQSAILNVYPLLDACSGLTGSTAICASNTSYSITIPSSAHVVWSKSSNLTQVGANAGTTYTVYATNSSQSGTGFITSTIYNSQNQVFMTRTKNIWIGKPSFTISGDTELETGLTGIAEINYNYSTNQGITNYVWAKSGALVSITGGPAIAKYKAGNTPGSGTVDLTMTNQCGSTFKYYIVRVIGGYLKVYPNPASEVLNIEIEFDKYSQSTIPKNAEIQLYDKMMGLKKVKRFDGTSTTISVSDLKSDFYFLKVILGDKTYEEKVIISRE